ncbi:MAG TPA: hypothetical protein DEA73_06470 [Peptococcaceae bacterium]|nr:hypothetical protein [Peptococcaceae bacterium]
MKASEQAFAAAQALSLAKGLRKARGHENPTAGNGGRMLKFCREAGALSQAFSLAREGNHKRAKAKQA